MIVNVSYQCKTKQNKTNQKANKSKQSVFIINVFVNQCIQNGTGGGWVRRFGDGRGKILPEDSFHIYGGAHAFPGLWVTIFFFLLFMACEMD